MRMGEMYIDEDNYHMCQKHGIHYGRDCRRCLEESRARGTRSMSESLFKRPEKVEAVNRAPPAEPLPSKEKMLRLVAMLLYALSNLSDSASDPVSDSEKLTAQSK